ncbi:MAG: S41 family peptidase [Defluviitaleaceae bacterium]|nr:S41 family peptidase [Defluviitaleaceae bacterium]
MSDVRGYIIAMMVAVVLSAVDIAYETAHLQDNASVLEAVLAISTANRHATFPEPYENLDEILRRFMTQNLDADRDSVIAERIAQYRELDMTRPVELTHEEIIYELDFLFNVLRYGYPAYQYFGGDEVFLPLKEIMLEELAQMTNPLSADAYLAHLLQPFLRSVIIDNHFWIDHHPMGVGSQQYMNDNLVIRKVDLDFLVEIDGMKYKILYVTHPDGHEIEGLLPTLTRDGEFAWAFGYVDFLITAWQPTFEITVNLENIDTGENNVRTVSLTPIPNANVSNDIFATRERQGITILENRRLPFSDAEPLVLEFVDTGATLRDEPILILDLRGHRGGIDGYTFQWIYQYTGQNPNFHMMFTHIRLYSKTVNAIAVGMEAVSPPDWQIWGDSSEHGFIQNENFLIVLMDNAIGSTGDVFVGYLRQLENVLFVGANTGGVLITGNVGGITLPLSRFDVNFGVSLNIRPDLSQFEGVGFMPDLWVPPQDALERVLKFIERYDILEEMQ